MSLFSFHLEFCEIKQTAFDSLSGYIWVRRLICAQCGPSRNCEQWANSASRPFQFILIICCGYWLLAATSAGKLLADASDESIRPIYSYFHSLFKLQTLLFALIWHKLIRLWPFFTDWLHKWIFVLIKNNLFYLIFFCHVAASRLFSNGCDMYSNRNRKFHAKKTTSRA